MHRKSEARVYFKAGKGREGWFDNNALLRQTDKAIDIFEGCFNGFVTATFGYNNTTSHQKRPDDELSARYMPKHPKIWKGKSGRCKMRNGQCPNGKVQNFYFTDNHPRYPGMFKGMRLILKEPGFHSVAELDAQCKNFKFADESASCCCHRMLYNQPDFADQKPALVELIESRGHICFFYPKFHCATNFIEQCWGCAKQKYCILPPTVNIDQMQLNVKKCLDDVPLFSICRYVCITSFCIYFF